MLWPWIRLSEHGNIQVCWWQQGSTEEDVRNPREKTEECDEENFSQGHSNLQSGQVRDINKVEVKFLFRIIFRSLTEDRAAAFSRIRRDVLEGTLEEMFEGNLTTSEMVRRQASGFPGNSERNTDRSKEDICQSRVEITTPFWAQNSDGQLRAILNNNEFEQAVHQEICTTSTTFRCSRDCSCEQKYKWHRLLAYDPNNDCAGIFMDWFLFPACCSCRCRKNPFHGK